MSATLNRPGLLATLKQFIQQIAAEDLAQEVRAQINAPLMLVDHHQEDRRRFIRMEAKRQAAIETLGQRWVLHPKNPRSPRKGQYNNFGVRVSA